MAKKQLDASAGKTKSPRNGAAKAVKTANGQVAPSASKRSVPSSACVVSAAAIGETAGEVWSALSQGDKQTLASLKKSVDAPPDLVVMAIGWLAREDKLLFEVSGRSIALSLK